MLRVGKKVIEDGFVLNLLGKLAGISFEIVEKRSDEEGVSVKVKGYVRFPYFPLLKIVDEEWVEFKFRDLAQVFCIEKYGSVLDERDRRFKRELVRARFEGTRIAVGVAKKRIEKRFVGEDFRSFYEKDFEVAELKLIYGKEGNKEWLEKLKKKHPEDYEAVREKFPNLSKLSPITPAQLSKIHALLKEKGISEEEYRKLLKERFGVSTSLALTKEEAQELIREIISRLNVV